MKTVLVRIEEGQAKQMREVASQIANPSINWMVKEGAKLFLMVIKDAQIAALVEGCPLEEVLRRVGLLWLENEAPVYRSAFKEIRAKIPHTKRQPVPTGS